MDNVHVAEGTPPVLALDIGTRSIVGLLARPQDGARLQIVDAAAVAHDDRAMRDGQVHDIPEVGRRIGLLVDRLAARTGWRPRRAYIAAAGRALATSEAEAELVVGSPGQVTEDLLRQLTVAGVARAVEGLKVGPAGRSSPHGFHCVGFSVVRYLLDNDVMANPLGQRGDRVQARIIATFLPRIVTDGLILALKKADLEVAGLTLEPIAAANIALAPTMRSLNLALIDIGAGTSDIALTRDGAVTGYAMVPMAGDAMTEALAQGYLLDFPEAERLKIAYGSQSPGDPEPPPLETSDILGASIRVAADDLDTLMQPVIADLSGRIAGEILMLNARAPAAVVCIGGGSLTPRLAPSIAQALGLPPSRVGVRGADLVKSVDLSALADRPDLLSLLSSPAGVTPLGIAWGALYEPGFHLVDAWVRSAGEEATRFGAEQRVQVLDLGRATVFDALVAAGIPARELAGRPGLGLAVRVNGQIRLVPGTAGQAAGVTVDGEPASLDTPLPDGAHIAYTPGADGKDAAAQVGDLAAAAVVAFVLEDRPIAVRPRLEVDGRVVEPETSLHDGAEVSCDRSLQGLLAQAGISLDRQPLRFTLDGIPQELPRKSFILHVDGEPAGPTTELSGGERVGLRVIEHAAPRVVDVIPDGAARAVALFLNAEPRRLPIRSFTVRRDGVEVPQESPVLEGDRLLVVSSAPPIVADLLALIQAELVVSASPTTRLDLRIDGEPAAFTTPLGEGAHVEARWVPVGRSADAPQELSRDFRPSNETGENL